MARRRKSSSSKGINSWVILGGLVFGGISLFSDDKPTETVNSSTSSTQQVQSLMPTTASEPTKTTEDKTASTTTLVAPVTVPKSNGDHSNAPLIKTEPKKTTAKDDEQAQSPAKSKVKKSRSESATYLKDDGAGYSSKCGSKRLCKQMNSCAEAQFYLRQCGLDRLDRDGDGVPCESLCLGKKKRR